jgi:hypothetical protein
MPAAFQILIALFLAVIATLILAIIVGGKAWLVFAAAVVVLVIFLVRAWN